MAIVRSPQASTKCLLAEHSREKLRQGWNKSSQSPVSRRLSNGKTSSFVPLRGEATKKQNRDFVQNNGLGAPHLGEMWGGFAGFSMLKPTILFFTIEVFTAPGQQTTGTRG